LQSRFHRRQRAFLVLDRNGNGIIDDGTEMFGNYTLPNHDNGFQALQTMARESYTGPTFPGVVNSDLPLFAQLLLWHDRNQDGISQSPELSRADALFSDIGLGYSPQPPARRPRQ